MKLRRETTGRPATDPSVLLVMVPGAAMAAADFATQGLVADAARCRPVVVETVDPGADSYLDGSVVERLLSAIDRARSRHGVERVWLAGISLGCQGILRCVRAREGLAEGVILLTPYLASTGLVARVGQAGGLLQWAAEATEREAPENALLRWLATTRDLPRIVLGRAIADRFAASSELLAEIVPADDVVTVAGGHDWDSWRTLWRMVSERDLFAAAPDAAAH